jgi:hypothetical protein
MLDCSACDAEAPCLSPMGPMGKLFWFRCVACGMDQSREVDELKEYMGEEEYEEMCEVC